MRNEVIFCFGSKPSFGISGRVSEISTSCFENVRESKNPTGLNGEVLVGFPLKSLREAPVNFSEKRLMYSRKV